MLKYLFAILVILLPLVLEGQSLEEKMESFSQAPLTLLGQNENLHLLIQEKKREIYEEGEKISQYIQSHEKEKLEASSHLVKNLQKELKGLELQWKNHIGSQGELDQVVINTQQMELFDFIQEYCSDDCLYIIPQELREVKVNIASKIPIPKASWEDFIRLALEENHIYIEKLTPLVKKLYKTSQKPLPSFHLAENTEAIKQLPSDYRTGLYFPLSPSQLQLVMENIHSVVSEQATRYLPLENGILLFGESKDLLAFQQFLDIIIQYLGEKQCLIINTFPLSFEECQKLNHSLFSKNPSQSSKVQIISLKNKKDCIVALGLKEHLSLLENILEKVKTHSQQQEKKNTFFLPLKHIDAQQAAPLVANFFHLLNSKHVPIATSQEKELYHPDFIVEEKSNALIGQCDENSKASLIEFIQKIDQPDIMVNIDILLFEKKISEDNEIGLSHLSMGSSASNTRSRGLAFTYNSDQEGVQDFIFKNPSLSNFPAIDLAYKLIMSQKNLRIHANPTLITCNKKMASISIADEISIKTGSTTKYKTESYERKEVGIKIEVTPSVQIPSLLDNDPYIHLNCNIHFDSVKTLGVLPTISKRSIQNEVRVKNGETIIIGGLKRKHQEENKGAIPYLANIPGLDKLLGFQSRKNENTEMFICLSPQVVQQSYWKEKYQKVERKKWRPGESLELSTLIENTASFSKAVLPDLELYHHE